MYIMTGLANSGKSYNSKRAGFNTFIDRLIANTYFGATNATRFSKSAVHAFEYDESSRQLKITSIGGRTVSLGHSSCMERAYGLLINNAKKSAFPFAANSLLTSQELEAHFNIPDVVQSEEGTHNMDSLTKGEFKFRTMRLNLNAEFFTIPDSALVNYDVAQTAYPTALSRAADHTFGLCAGGQLMRITLQGLTRENFFQRVRAQNMNLTNFKPWFSNEDGVIKYFNFENPSVNCLDFDSDGINAIVISPAGVNLSENVLEWNTEDFNLFNSGSFLLLRCKDSLNGKPLWRCFTNNLSSPTFEGAPYIACGENGPPVPTDVDDHAIRQIRLSKGGFNFDFYSDVNVRDSSLVTSDAGIDMNYLYRLENAEGTANFLVLCTGDFTYQLSDHSKVPETLEAVNVIQLIMGTNRAFLDSIIDFTMVDDGTSAMSGGMSKGIVQSLALTNRSGLIGIFAGSVGLTVGKMTEDKFMQSVTEAHLTGSVSLGGQTDGTAITVTSRNTIDGDRNVFYLISDESCTIGNTLKYSKSDGQLSVITENLCSEFITKGAKPEVTSNSSRYFEFNVDDPLVEEIDNDVNTN